MLQESKNYLKVMNVIILFIDRYILYVRFVNLL